jgi:hypothetical protein
MRAIDVIQQLAVAPSRQRKEQILLDAYGQNCREFFILVRLAMDPFINFGIKKVAEILEDDGDPGSLTCESFLQLCNDLRTRKLSGDTARAAINQAAETCHAVTWNQLYRRVLLKDLRVIDQTVMNKVLKRLGSAAEAFQIPQFRCQMATRCLDRPQTGHYLIDVDIAGKRCITVLDKSAWSYDTKGMSYELPVELLQPLCLIAAHLTASIVLDGVITGSGEYLLFDIIQLEDFRAKSSNKTQQQRRRILEQLQTSGVFSASRLIRVVPQVEVDLDSKAGNQLFEEFVRQAIERGERALMLKKPDALYQAKQSRAWMTWPITSLD